MVNYFCPESGLKAEHIRFADWLPMAKADKGIEPEEELAIQIGNTGFGRRIGLQTNERGFSQIRAISVFPPPHWDVLARKRQNNGGKVEGHKGANKVLAQFL
jgi:hypothetical protein